MKTTFKFITVEVNGIRYSVGDTVVFNNFNLGRYDAPKKAEILTIELSDGFGGLWATLSNDKGLVPLEDYRPVTKQKKN